MRFAKETLNTAKREARQGCRSFRRTFAAAALTVCGKERRSSVESQSAPGTAPSRILNRIGTNSSSVSRSSVPKTAAESAEFLFFRETEPKSSRRIRFVRHGWLGPLFPVLGPKVAARLARRTTAPATPVAWAGPVGGRAHPGNRGFIRVGKRGPDHLLPFLQLLSGQQGQ